jgi:predicted glycoside hydrolase/deacetylase ChbG (UPF0249 family)
MGSFQQKPVRLSKNISAIHPFILLIATIFILLACGCTSPSEMKKVEGPVLVIINGDDLCLDEPTSLAIIEAFNKGVLTSTTAFINLPGAPESLIRIHNENPDLPIGLHLNITHGRPVSSSDLVSSLTDKNGNFYSIDDILPKLPGISIEELKIEIKSQIEKFLSTGVPLSHLDYHHHILALYAPFFDLVREAALEYNLPVRNPVPISIYNQIHLKDKSGGGSDVSMKKLIWYAVKHPVKSMKMRKHIGPDAFIEQERLMMAQEIKSPDWFIDLFYNNATVDNFIDIINQLPPGVSEIMCHPGIIEELEVLTNPLLISAIKDSGIKLIDYSYLKKAQQH